MHPPWAGPIAMLKSHCLLNVMTRSLFSYFTPLVSYILQLTSMYIFFLLDNSGYAMVLGGMSLATLCIHMNSYTETLTKVN